jgi:hypothetical protein
MTEETLFEEALARVPEERAAFLEQACAGRSELRAAVEARLAAIEQHTTLPNATTVGQGQPAHETPTELSVPATEEFTPKVGAAGLQEAANIQLPPASAPGAVIAGRYILAQKIGEGGMGVVWVAKQTEPVKRNVALKLIKTGMDSRAVLQRFEQERQALALMDHPNIARVLDGGLTPTGQPFFVMELVGGPAVDQILR